MKKVLEKIGCLFLVLFLFLPLVVNANIMCNDGTRSPSCQDCHQGCCSHHGGCAYGGGDSSSSSSNSYSNSNYVYQQPIVQEPPKSSDTSLKSITIDEEELSLSDTLSYQTKNDRVTISVLPNDSKSTVDYNPFTELEVGENIINIKVTAEDGSSKEYQLNITREEINNKEENDEEEYTFLDEKEEYKVTASDIIVSLLFVGILGSIICYAVKRKKSKF